MNWQAIIDYFEETMQATSEAEVMYKQDATKFYKEALMNATLVLSFSFRLKRAWNLVIAPRTNLGTVTIGDCTRLLGGVAAIAYMVGFSNRAGQIRSNRITAFAEAAEASKAVLDSEKGT